MKRILEMTPAYKKLKVKAEENNHRADGKALGDKWLKGLQQRLINLARIQAAFHLVLAQAGENVTAAAQQFFMYLLDTEKMVLKERNWRSIPGAVRDESANNLFTLDDLKQESSTARINSAGMFAGAARPQKSSLWCLCTPREQKLEVQTL